MAKSQFDKITSEVPDSDQVKVNPELYFSGHEELSSDPDITPKDDYPTMEADTIKKINRQNSDVN
jgi:hypothetical protein